MLGPGPPAQAQPSPDFPPPAWGDPNDDDDFDNGMMMNNDPNFFVDNPSWSERERRQRSIRLLMMFLLMLLLMDNEEQTTRNRNDANLRKNNKRKKANYYLEPIVYERRQRQEEMLQQFTQGHERYKNLMQKNSGRNVQQDITKWAEDHSDPFLQKDEFETTIDNINSESHRNRDDNTAAALDEKDPNDNQKVFHYPWNTTGFYRGEWQRLEDTTTTTTTTKTTTPLAGIGETTRSPKLEESSAMEFIDAVHLEQRMLTVLAEKKDHKAGVFLLPPGKEVIMRDDNNLTSSKFDLLQEPSAAAAAAAAATAMKLGGASSKSQINVGKSHSTTSSSYLRGSSSSNQDYYNDDTYYSYGNGLTPKNNHFDGTFTKASGRAAFQLFTRAIPSMKEISLIDGFIKLYDSNMPGYSSRKDILMRVRGVLIHSIGRISLVSNAAPSRTVFVLPPVDGDDYYTKMHYNEESEKTKAKSNGDTVKKRTKTKKKTKKITKKPDTEDIISTRRRRLEENLSKDLSALMSSSASEAPKSSSSKQLLQATMEEIRDDALELFPGVDPGHYVDQMKSQNINNQETITDSFIKEIPLIQDDHQLHAKKIVQRRTMEVENLHLAPDEEMPKNRTTKEEKEEQKEEEVWEGEEEEEDGEEVTEGKEVEGVLETKKQQHTQKQDKRRTMETQIQDGNIRPGEDKSFLWSDIVIPYPYVQDDEDETIRKTRTPAARKMPPREQLLERNAGQCEFEVSMDVQEVEWTIGEWKKLVGRKVNEGMKLNPSTLRDVAEMEEDDVASGQKGDGNNNNNGSNNNNSKEGGRSSKLSGARSSHTKLKLVQDQALAMTLVGIIHSPNCHFTAKLNVTALRTDWEHTTGKAINYSFYMMLTCLIQIMVLLRQLLHTQAQSAAIRVSLLCIGWQTVLDALLCLGHIYLSLAMQPLFTAFASVAFFKLLIFCVIEMKYMALIIQARNNNNGGNTTELLRRQVAMLHLRFYVALFGSFLAFFYAGEKYRLVYILLLYSFWVPQIIQNIITEAKKPLHNYYIYGMSFTRLIAPLYIFGIKYNFLKEVYPESPTDIFMCEMLILWVFIQTAILVAQGKYGTRFMIPARFLPPKFDYSRPIPPSLLPPGVTQQTEQEKQQQQQQQQQQASSTTGSISKNSSKNRSRHNSISTSPVPTSTADELPQHCDRHTTGVTTRNRIKKGSRRHKMKSETMTAEPVETSNGGMVDIDINGNASGSNVDTDQNNTNTLDCVICYNAIDVNNRRGYMLAPCDHIFHRDCLIQWMEIKMECPVCRTDLPSL